MATLKHRSSDASFAPPEDSIPQVQLSDGDAEVYRAQTCAIVETTLKKEISFRYMENEILDPKQWKLVKTKERMRVFKRVVVSNDEFAPMMLGVGFIEGTIEDALYGLHHKTTAEMRTTSAYINPDILDTAVLANLDLGTDEDPFRYLGLKWRVAQTPGGSIIKNRGVCTLESMGMDTDAQDIKYGYQVIKSVPVPIFPALPATAPAASSAANVVHAQMLLCCIFRQVEPSVVAFYSTGVFDLKGYLPAFLAYNTSADMVLSISKSVDCATAKRLTTMVLESERTAVFSRSNRRLRRNLVKAAKDVVMSATCTLCMKAPSKLSPPCRPCKICSTTACSRCFVKTDVMAIPFNVPIVCCKWCVAKAKEMPIDPREPYPLIELNEEERRR